MKIYRADSVVVALLLVVFTFLAASPVRAQIITKIPTGRGPEGGVGSIAERDQRRREWNLHHMDKVVVSEEERRLERLRQQLLIEQVTKDYRLIQKLNNEIIIASSSSSPLLDYKLIARHTGDINRRASRLKQHLALPKVDETGETRQSLATRRVPIKSLLRALDARIASFVSNPFFKNPDVLDADHSAKASRDLRQIIELSFDIREYAEQLHKSFNAAP